MCKTLSFIAAQLGFGLVDSYLEDALFIPGYL